MTAGAGGAAAAGPPSVGSFSGLLDAWGEAGAIAPWLSSPAPDLAPGALPWGAAGTRVAVDVAVDVAADASVRILGASGTLKPEPGTAGPLAALPGALALLPLPAEPGASPPGAEAGAAARSKLGAKAAVLPALAVKVGAAGIGWGSAPAAPPGGAVTAPGGAPVAAAAWAAAKRSVFPVGGGEKAGGGKEAVSADGDADTGSGGLPGGGGLPGTGNPLPLKFASCCLLTALLRAGLPPASRRAPAKSWLAPRDGGDSADAGALSSGASRPLAGLEIGGIAFD